jgi:hypothetical protein
LTSPGIVGILAELLIEAWLRKAPKTLARNFLAKSELQPPAALNGTGTAALLTGHAQPPPTNTTTGRRRPFH